MSGPSPNQNPWFSGRRASRLLSFLFTSCRKQQKDCYPCSMLFTEQKKKKSQMFCRECRICAMVSIDIVFLLTAGCRVASALTHCSMLEQQILCAGLFRSSWFILIMGSSISIPLVSFCSVPFLSEKQDSEINTTLGLLSHFHCFLIIPRHHCPKPGTCLG